MMNSTFSLYRCLPYRRSLYRRSPYMYFILMCFSLMCSLPLEALQALQAPQVNQALPNVATNASFSQLYPGLQYKKITTKSNQIVHLLEIDPDKINIINLHADNKATGRRTVKDFAIENRAIAAINGGFFNTDGSPSGILKIQNRWYGETRKMRATIGWSNGGKKALIDKIKIEKRKNRTHPFIIPYLQPENKAAWQQFENMVSGIPLLMFNHKVVNLHYGEKFAQKFAKERHARTAIGLLNNGHWIFAVVEKSNDSGSPGMTIKEIASVMQSAGAKAALNLDGGGSSTLYIDRAVVNNPQGDVDEDLGTRVERRVGDVILLLRR